MLEELIHPIQTSFVKDPSILDNICTFWEAITLARLEGQDLAILLLDFEKAYDRVHWGFLKDGFSARGVCSTSRIDSKCHMVREPWHLGHVELMNTKLEKQVLEYPWSADATKTSTFGCMLSY